MWFELKYYIYTNDGKLFEYTKDPVIIPINKGIFLKEIEEKLVNAEVGKTYEFLLKKPYGDRSEELLKIIPISEFKKRNIEPVVGLVIDADGMRGIVRSINSGRVIVDFNHPLAGRDIIFRIELIRKVDDLKEKIKGIINYFYGIDMNNINIEINENEKKIKISANNLPDSAKDLIKKYIDEIKDYEII